MRKLHFFLASLVACTGYLCPVAAQPDRAQSLYLKSRVSWEKGDFESSILTLDSLLEGGFMLGDYHQALARNILGLDYYETGHFRQALGQFLLADSLSGGPEDSNRKAKISIYNNLGLLYSWTGDYTNSLSYYDQAGRLMNALPKDEKYFQDLSMVLFNKGLALFNLDRPTEALDFLQRSERIKEQRAHPYLGSVYYNLARVYEELSDPWVAEEYYKKSIRQWTVESGEGFYQLGNVYLHYGLLLTERGEIEEGQQYIEKGFRNYLSNYGRRHPLTAEGYLHRAEYNLQHAEFRKALDMVQESLISNSAHFNNREVFSNPGNNDALHQLTLLKSFALKTEILEGLAGEAGEAQRKKDVLGAALDVNRRAVELLYYLQEGYLSRESRNYLLSGRKEIFSSGIRLNLKAFDLTGDENFRAGAFLLAARGKSNELVFEIREKQRFYLESLKDTLAASVIGLRHSIDQYSNMIRNENQTMDPDSAGIAELQELLFQDRRELEEKMNLLRSRNPRINRYDLNRAEFSLDRVQAQLGRNETLLEYYLADAGAENSKELFLFAVNRNSLHVHSEMLDGGFLLRFDQLIRDLYGKDPSGETTGHFDTLKIILNDSYRRFIQPVEHYLRGSGLVIAPDEELAYLPFELLLTEYQKDSILNYAGMPYLLNRYFISYLYNTQTINRERKPGLFFPRVNVLLPEYTDPETESALQLRGARVEAREILQMTRGRGVIGEFDRLRLSHLMEENAVIHMAMHAHASRGKEMQSYFLLHQVEDSLFSNRLYGYEISSMNLASPMVVLSGCSTGGGILEQGEGIISLSRSFILGGASAVVYSLWPMDDAQGRRIMTGFYRNLRSGRSLPNALFRAKKKYLANTPPSYAHPYYWATFQVTGDPASISVHWWGKAGVIAVVVVLFIFLYLRRLTFFRRERTSSA